MKSGICVAGNLLVDKINEIESYPDEGQLVKINGISLATGGCVPNTATGLKKLCPELDVYASGRTGNDSEGLFLRKQLKNCGINVDNIILSEDKTSFTEVMSIRGGERTFFTYPGASDEFCHDDINFEKAQYKMLHLGYFLLLKKIDESDGLLILRDAKNSGIKTSIDLVSNKNGNYRKVLPCLEYVDNLIINEMEGGALAEISPEKGNLLDICKKLKNYGVRERVIIHCPELSVCLDDKFTFLPSYDLPDGFIKGSTGAGDAFCSGCLIGIYKGWSDEEILNMGSSNAVMALSCQNATGGLDCLENTLNFCKQFTRKKICL